MYELRKCNKKCRLQNISRFGWSSVSQAMVTTINDDLCLSHIQPRAPYDFYHPYDFLLGRPSEAPLGILRRCCSRVHIRLRARTIWRGCTLMVWSNNSQDSMGTRTKIFNFFHILRDPYGARAGTQGCRTAALRKRKGIDTTRIGKTPTRAPYLAVRGPYGSLTGPLRVPQGLFTGCLQSLNPYGARKIIMHALKLYGPRTGKQNSYGAARGPCGPRDWTYDFCSKQPGNSPYGARECDVTEALLCH